jgi:cytoskeletal protein CcmA (bactofilin family)
MWKRDQGADEPAPATGWGETPLANIGQSVVIHGDLRGSEDLVIEGQVDGTIELKDHTLTIGPHGRVKAEVSAKTVIVLGTVNGRMTTSDKVDMRAGAHVDGDIVSPRVAIAEGATFNGSVDMKPKARRDVQPSGAATDTAPKANDPTWRADVQPLAAAPAH